ncbi:hypothetical protein B0A55_11183 [Friedmanniomyces simplex]|uniref:N-acetyltransferase domain-containing protein n=1 Tax=Friedmanniomyces simplex TaxID=329884 RepID=A0A4V5NFQ4_9PEZI|nr:hypothetical protein B0A55_11183 [Friedmanniomyces simplex]
MAGTQPIVELPDGLAIREWRHSDIASSARHLNNKRIWDQLRNRIPFPYRESDAAHWIDFCQDPANHVRSGKWTAEGGSEGPAIATSFAVTLNDEAVGSIGLDFKDDIYFRTAEIGYWLAEEIWGKGVMSRLLPLFMEWAWETFGILLRVGAETYEANGASGKVLGKAGFEYEGRRPDAVCKNGVVGAALMWGALRPR